jgi:ABC-type Mn2+/Zn2+ transport system ATPase subunit
LSVKKVSVADTMKSSPDICADKVTIQMGSSATSILRNLNLVVDKGTTVICSGPVESGKTALVKALLGELQRLVAQYQYLRSL